MFTLLWTRGADATYRELKNKAELSANNRKAKSKKKPGKHESLFKQLNKTLANLSTNPKHPSLHTHEYQSLENPLKKGEKVFEAYVQNQTPAAFRVFWCYGPKKSELTIVTITPHP
jgi:hypothetical protein